LDHSFEEIRAATLDLLAGRESASYPPNQYQRLLVGVGEIFAKRSNPNFRQTVPPPNPNFTGLSSNDAELFLEVFWSLFREGIITLGLNDANREFPHCRVTEFGRKILAHPHAYFFHDVS
jgi:hypothetical protein